MTILVTGATGKTGRHVVDHLLRDGHRVRALTRDPATAQLPAEAEPVAGDLTAPATLAPALEGVEALHLITNDANYDPLTTGPEIAALAEDAGVRRATVLWNGRPGPVEAALAASRLAWTRLEPTDFMSNAFAWIDEIGSEGIVREPFADAPNAVVHEADVGAVAAAALTSDAHAGKVLPITGPQVLTARERLATIAAALGRTLAFEELTEAQARERWRAAGHTEEFIELLATWQREPPPSAYTVSDTVQRVTGRSPRTFAQWAQEHAAAFGPVAAGRAG